jgi:hypothetical protein
MIVSPVVNCSIISCLFLIFGGRVGQYFDIKIILIVFHKVCKALYDVSLFEM